MVNPGSAGNCPPGEGVVAETGTRVQLQGYGFVLAFWIVHTDGNTKYWATNGLAMMEVQRLKYAAGAWGIESYLRGLKHRCDIERVEVRAAHVLCNHIGCSSRAVLRLEQHRLATGVSWWEAKTNIIHEAVRSYLAHPRSTLPSTATA